MLLPIYHIQISEQARLRLQQNVWSNRFVPAFRVTSKRFEPIQVRFRGGHTRNYPKKSYEIIMPDKRIHLNAEYDDPSMVRNALSFYFFDQIGVPSPKTRHCELIINGESAGVYLEIESVDRLFFKKRHIAVQSLMYAVNDYANFSRKVGGKPRLKESLFEGYKQMIGGEQDILHLKSFIAEINGRQSRSLQAYLTEHLDVNNYLMWLAGAVCTGNYDGFDQNYAFYRHQSKRYYRIIPWDYEGTWGRNCYGKLCESNLVRVEGYNFLTKQMLRVPAFRAKYKKILNQVLDQHFTLSRIEPVIDHLHSQIAPSIYQDESRKWSLSTFDKEPELMKIYLVERRVDILKAISKL
ncbi:CotH kinase family protein [Paenibacillus sp. N1-5-1-14]|uniref:CotH kinase family protein n=1 Tax=Paenibacillus radicibacter TaxID=2972488 RepID=UPI00215924F1|nr:CotH kinase family protein [Paenibacillus radicibacter]MCR8641349.1 CotH kinase family protein [Paenibacillus radicibacter]